MDLLELFASEKTAADSYEPVETENLKPLDPGERALAGLAFGSSIYAAALPWIGGEVLKFFAEKGSHPWGTVSVQGAKSIDDALGLAGVNDQVMPFFKNVGAGQNAKITAEDMANAISSHTDAGGSKARVLGALDVVSRKRAHNPLKRGLSVLEMLNIKNVVDSFIDKNKLADKGVTLNFRSGPISGVGPHYDIPQKKVFLPRVSKEIALHELGHAADYTGGAIGKIRGIAEPVLKSAVYAAIPIALAAGDHIKKHIPGTVDDKAIAYMQDHAPEIVAATIAATDLYPEAKASIAALRHIKDVEGAAAMRQAARKLIPAWSTYALAAIPAMIGLSLARKYMRETRDLNAKQEKTAEFIGSTINDIFSDLQENIHDVWHVAKQIGSGTVDSIQRPERFKRILQSAKAVGTSPTFIHGALVSAIPATLGALYIYGRPGGEVMRANISRDPNSHTPKRFIDVIGTREAEDWRSRNPLKFAGIVGAGAALSGGVLARLFSDLKEVL